MTTTATAEARAAVAEQVTHERARRKWSVETAILKGGIGHMTWRRIERGERVQTRSYSGVDTAFGWTSGHTLSLLRESAEPSASPPDDAFETILHALDSVKLSELAALATIVSQRLDAKRERLGAIRDILASDDSYPASDRPAMTLQRYRERLPSESANALQQALLEYLCKQRALGTITQDVYRLETDSTASENELAAIQQRAEQARAEFRDVADHLDDVEAQAITDLRENGIEPDLSQHNEGNADGVDRTQAVR